LDAIAGESLLQWLGVEVGKELGPRMGADVGDDFDVRV
jgi:hypothetical protein